MKQYTAQNIRNISLAGHGSDGKTSLTEAMLYFTGATDRLGTIADGNTVCDFDPEEIKRQVSVSSSIAPMEYSGVKINVLDTPGLFDFAGGLYEGVRASDIVVDTLSAKSGSLVGTEKAFKLASITKKARAFFISKMDQENADFGKAFASLRDTFGDSVCPIIVPVGDVYVDMVENKAYKFDAKGKASEVPMPTDSVLEEYASIVNEAVANADDDLAEKYFSDEPFTRDELIFGVKKGIATTAIAPVFCGDALTLKGIELFLNSIRDLFPSAADAACEIAHDADGKEVKIDCDASAPLAAFVFKTVADPFVGKLSFVKVVAGTVSATMAPPINSRTGNVDRLGKLVSIRGKQQDAIESIVAGDIAAITKLSDAQTGDTLCDAKRVVSLRKTDFPKPCMSMAMYAKGSNDDSKTASSITRLMEEDPTISYEVNKETKQQILSGLGEQHLDVIVSKLMHKFGVDLGLETPRVPYRETIRKKVKVQGKHKKQSGGHGQYGDVWVEFEPTDSEEMVFEENVFGGSVPRNFFPAVEKGLREAVKVGMLAGYPMVGVLARLVDGSYHPVDSNDMSFQMAARLAYKAGIPQAGPVLLEPIGDLKVTVPDDHTGDIIGDLNKRRGRVLGMNPDEDEKGYSIVEAEVPMSEMHDFTTVIRSMTQGRGSFSLHFARYEELPKMLEANVIEESKKWMAEEEDK